MVAKKKSAALEAGKTNSEKDEKSVKPRAVKPRTTKVKLKKVEPVGKKLFVLDTNVLLHDRQSLFNFEENDILIPFTVIEELDKLKSGNTSANHEARVVSRMLRKLIEKYDATSGCIDDGIPLNLNTEFGYEGLGNLYFSKADDSFLSLPSSVQINDNLIIKTAVDAKKDPRFKDHSSGVILVSKDNNVFIKCRMLKIACQDYNNDRVQSEHEALYGGKHELGIDVWNNIVKDVDCVEDHGTGIKTFTVSGLDLKARKNEYISFNGGNDDRSIHGIVHESDDNTLVFSTLKNYKTKNNIYGINAKNDEQNFANNVLLDPEIDIVALTGKAGSGKTLLALCAGFHHVFTLKTCNKIIATRVLIPLGEGIGFLPGDESEKVTPWMGAFSDNLEVIAPGVTASRLNSKDGTITMEDLNEALEIKTIDFMRGRTFQNKFLIIDEAQNLTLRQIKAIVSRAGQGTKVIVMGNTAQIDTPYLTPETSGLTILIDRFRGQRNFAHIHLNGVERSLLAEQADELLK